MSCRLSLKDEKEKHTHALGTHADIKGKTFTSLYHMRLQQLRLIDVSAYMWTFVLKCRHEYDSVSAMLCCADVYIIKNSSACMDK